jgi:hypothetical protein
MSRVEPAALLRLLSDSGGWPILEGEDWVEWPESWLTHLALLSRRYAVADVIFEWTVATDERNSSRNLIRVC